MNQATYVNVTLFERRVINLDFSFSTLRQRRSRDALSRLGISAYSFVEKVSKDARSDGACARAAAKVK